ncbi:MAG TPA: hypothetical protein VJQ82_20955 [Terriglobales bacterium]|nr:hypothetical protein [Terriglobales bacterium]
MNELLLIGPGLIFFAALAEKKLLTAKIAKDGRKGRKDICSNRLRQNSDS